MERSLKAITAHLSGSIHEQNEVLDTSHGIIECILEVSSAGAETAHNSSSDNILSFIYSQID